MAPATMRLLAVLLVVGVLVQAPQRASAGGVYKAGGPAGGKGYPSGNGGSSDNAPGDNNGGAGGNNGGGYPTIVKKPRGPVCYDNNGFYKCKTRGPPFAIFPTSWCDCIHYSSGSPLSWPHSCEVYAIAGNMRPIPC